MKDTNEEVRVELQFRSLDCGDTLAHGRPTYHEHRSIFVLQREHT